MTEKEKAEKGLLYNANYDADLIAERTVCKDLCFKFNSCLPSNTKKSLKILRKIIKNIGENPVVTPPFYCDYGYNIKLGNNFYSNHNLIILDGAKVEIGDNVFIAPNCTISTAGHPTDKNQRNEGLEFALPIKISSNVWIGANVCILPGVTIGEGSVIGAGSVVTKDIPANVVAVGCPCKPIRQITEKDKQKYNLSISEK